MRLSSSVGSCCLGLVLLIASLEVGIANAKGTKPGAAAVFRLVEKSGEAVPLPPPNADGTLAHLVVMFANAGAFGKALAAFDADTAGMGDSCRIIGFRCTDDGVLHSIALSGIEGHVNLSAIPRTVRSLSLIQSRFDDAWDMTAIPPTLQKLTLSHSRFASASAPSSDGLVMNPRHSGLQELHCRDCGLTAVAWDSIPALLRLDFSQNPGIATPIRALPPTLRFLNLSHCRARQALTDLLPLPTSLTVMDVSDNELSGFFTDIQWPPYLELLNASHNAMKGDLDGDALPVQLAVLDVSHNFLSGTMRRMQHLPLLALVRAENNELEEVDWLSMPVQLTHALLNSNRLRGPIPAKALPAQLQDLSLAHNQLTGPLVFEELPPALEHLDVAHNQLSGKVDLTRLNEGLRFVHIQHNKFTGAPDLTKLPVDLRQILIHGNPWLKQLPSEML